MPVDTQKRAIGVFPDLEHTEAAIDRLKNSDFPIDKVTVVGKHTPEGEKMVRNPHEIIPDKTTENLQQGAVRGATLGGLVGALAGLATLVVPGVGTVFVTGFQAAAAGMFAGVFAGGLGGSWIGMVAGDAVSEEKANFYSDRLSRGNYLVIVDGSDEEISRAESILKAQGILDWGVYGKN